MSYFYFKYGSAATAVGLQANSNFLTMDYFYPIYSIITVFDKRLLGLPHPQFQKLVLVKPEFKIKQ